MSRQPITDANHAEAMNNRKKRDFEIDREFLAISDYLAMRAKETDRDIVIQGALQAGSSHVEKL